MRRFSWVAAAVAVLLVAVGCSDDNRDHTSTSRSTPTSTTKTTPPSGPTSNTACALVTQSDATAVFGEPARPAAPADAGEDSVCAWQAGDDGEGAYQFLELRVHEGSSLESRTTNTGGTAINIQRAQGGRVYALRYAGTDGGESAAKTQAVNALADSVIARAE